jgi:dTDP-glucose 4,6-dehydratase
MNMAKIQPILVTGGAGFIGSNFILHLLASEVTGVINLDKLTYAGNPANLATIESDPRYTFVHGDICDLVLVRRLFARHRPWAVVHLAAESHVDRSIHGAEDFIRTNIEGTFHLLQAAREFWEGLRRVEKEQFRFLHVSTDEVYGSLGPTDPAFTEGSPYSPNSPYSATKAASDHLVRAYHHTYGLPVLTTNCSNNYGPYQFPEKLIPLMIHNAMGGKPLPVYGDGLQIRDWLYVSDHCEALRQVLHRGTVGQTYNIGGGSEKNNLGVVQEICALLRELRPGPNYESLITHVQDRPGHDRRYAIDNSKIRNEIGWVPEQTFSNGLRKTVQWYLQHQEWVSSVTTGAYRKWVELQYHAVGRSTIG